MKKKILFIALFCLMNAFNQTLYSQEKGTIRGYVTDDESDEALAFCNAFIKGLNIGTTSDVNGYFIIPGLEANKSYKLIVSFIGYQPAEYQVTVFPNKVTHLDIKLIKSTVVLDVIEKVAKKTEESNTTNLGIRNITIRELQMMPKSVETDVLRSLQYISGIKTTGDVSARYYVRGGNSDQNMILIDGINLYNPFHALGLFSVIDPEIIQGIEFYKSGFPPKYSGRLSSVLDITTRDGNKNKYSGQFAASYLSAKGSIEGPIPHGSFLMTGRKSYSTEILKKFLNDESVPTNFHDLFIKFNYSNPNLDEGSKFTLSYFSSADNISANDNFAEDYKWTNSMFGFNWFKVSKDKPLFFNLSFSLSNYVSEKLPLEVFTDFKKNQVKNFNIQADYNYVYTSKDQLNVGLNIKDIATDLYLYNNLGVLNNVGNKGTSITIYGNYRLSRFKNFGLEVGTNINLTFLSPQKGNLFEPRIKTTYSFSPLLTVKASWGIYQQNIATLTNEKDLLTIFEPWLILPDYMEPSYSIVYSSGMDSYLTENLKLEIEAYYKKQINVPAYNDKKIFFTDNDFLTSELESYGWELTTNYNYKRTSLLLSYTNAWTYKTKDEFRYLPNFDSRHSVNFSFAFEWGWGISTNIIWVYNSGRPFTSIRGYFNKLRVNDYFFNDGYHRNLETNTVLGSINLRRLPVYHRLDFNISKKFKLFYIRGEASFSIINVYDRKNIFYFDRETGKRVNLLPFLPTATIKVKL